MRLGAAEQRNFCKLNIPTAAIFIDVTTEFDDRQKSLFVEGIQKITRSFTSGQRIVIVTIEETFTSSSRLYEGCVPYCDSSEGWTWVWDLFFSDCTSGLVKLRKREQQSDIARALRYRLGKTSDLPNSEIVRTLAYTLKSLDYTEGRVNLFIFSDLIENSLYMSGREFFSNPIDELMFAITKEGLLPRLNGSTVKAFGVGRGGNVHREALSQNRLQKLQKFWRTYFESAGAADIYIGEALSIE